MLGERTCMRAIATVSPNSIWMAVLVTGARSKGHSSRCRTHSRRQRPRCLLVQPASHKPVLVKLMRQRLPRSDGSQRRQHLQRQEHSDVAAGFQLAAAHAGHRHQPRALRLRRTTGYSLKFPVKPSEVGITA